MVARPASSFALGLLLLALGAAGGWLVHGLSAPVGALGAGEEPPVDVRIRAETAEVVVGELPLVVAAIGVVEPAPGAVLALSSRASGRVAEVLASPGARVERGSVLLRFERAPLELAVAESEARAAQAASELEEFERSGRARRSAELRATLESLEVKTSLAASRAQQLAPLHEDGLVSDRALAEAEADARRSRSEEEVARAELVAFEESTAALRLSALRAAKTATDAALEQARAVLAEADVRAPLDGEVLELAVRPGQRIDAGLPLGSLACSEARFLRFGLAPERARVLRLGALATWTDDGGGPRRGRVAAILPRISVETGMQDVLVAPEPADSAQPPGLVVRGELEIGRLSAVVLVPERAIVRHEDETSVVVAGEDSRTERRSVRVIGRHAGLVAVEGDLRAAERVLVEAAFNLPDGARLAPSAPAAEQASEARSPR